MDFPFFTTNIYRKNKEVILSPDAVNELTGYSSACEMDGLKVQAKPTFFIFTSRTRKQLFLGLFVISCMVTGASL